MKQKAWARTIIVLVLLASALPLFIQDIPEAHAVYVYTFNGLHDETTNADLLDGVNVTAYFETAAQSTFFVNGSSIQTFTEVPRYFVYDLVPYAREYWLSTEANETTFYIYNASTTSYVINFLDYTGVSNTYKYVEAKINVFGSWITVEKRKIDALGSISMSLVDGSKYEITVSSLTNSYVYGDVLMTAATAIQLTLRAVDFPKETLLSQSLIRIYSTRIFAAPNGYINTTFADSTNLTTSITISIFYSNGSTAYTYTGAVYNLQLNWTSAANNTRYFLTALISHPTYGLITWKQVFAEQGSSVEPFSMGWLGSVSFNTAYLLPSLLILFAAGCFSALNAEVGAIMLVIVAIILTWMGWIPIPGGALVAGLFLAVLMGLVYSKRRVMIY
jgi:hypothetical protein